MVYANCVQAAFRASQEVATKEAIAEAANLRQEVKCLKAMLGLSDGIAGQPLMGDSPGLQPWHSHVLSQSQPARPKPSSLMLVGLIEATVL